MKTILATFALLALLAIAANTGRTPAQSTPPAQAQQIDEATRYELIVQDSERHWKTRVREGAITANEVVHAHAQIAFYNRYCAPVSKPMLAMAEGAERAFPASFQIELEYVASMPLSQSQKCALVKEKVIDVLKR